MINADVDVDDDNDDGVTPHTEGLHGCLVYIYWAWLATTVRMRCNADISCKSSLPSVKTVDAN